MMFPSQSDFQRLCAMHSYFGPLPHTLTREGAKVHPDYFVSREGKYELDWRKIYDESILRYFRDRRKVYDVSKRPTYDPNDFINIPEQGWFDGTTIDRELRGLLQQLLAYDPIKRISARDALRHKYFLTNVPQKRSSL